MKDVAVILAAAGRSTRFNDPYQKKVYASVHGKPVWQYSAQLFADHPRVGQIIMTIAMEDQEMVQEKFAGNLTLFGVEVVLGGAERSESVRNALQRIRPGIALVAIHDAARPCLSRQSLNQVIEEASNHRSFEPKISNAVMPIRKETLPMTLRSSKRWGLPSESSKATKAISRSRPKRT